MFLLNFLFFRMSVGKQLEEGCTTTHSTLWQHFACLSLEIQTADRHRQVLGISTYDYYHKSRKKVKMKKRKSINVAIPVSQMKPLCLISLLQIFVQMQTHFVMVSRFGKLQNRALRSKKSIFPVLHWFTMVRALDIENVSTFGSQGSEKAWLHISFQKK